MNNALSFGLLAVLAAGGLQADTMTEYFQGTVTYSYSNFGGQPVYGPIGGAISGSFSIEPGTIPGFGPYVSIATSVGSQSAYGSTLIHNALYGETVGNPSVVSFGINGSAQNVIAGQFFNLAFPAGMLGDLTASDFPWGTQIVSSSENKGSAYEFVQPVRSAGPTLGYEVDFNIDSVSLSPVSVPDPPAVPEPSTAGLLSMSGLGLIGLAAARKCATKIKGIVDHNGPVL